MIDFRQPKQGSLETRVPVRPSSATGIPSPHACARCEYFDGGGERLVSQAVAGLRVIKGDCLNSLGPTFQTNSHETCGYFVEAS